MSLVGSRFGRLVVIQRLKPKGKSRCFRWACKCDCGKEREFTTGVLSSGHTKSCGCFRKDAQREAGKKNTIGYGLAARNKILNEYKAGAFSRKIDWKLTKEEFFSLIVRNCFYCDEQPKQVRKCRGFNGEFVYNGVDRKNPRVGYLSDNVVTCCGKCNYAKLNMEQEEFFKYIQKIETNLRNKGLI